MLSTYRRRLSQLAELPATEYVQTHAYEGRYLVQAAAQICIDLAHHVIASNGWPPTVEYRDSFARLTEHDVLEDELAARLQDLAGLRNRLVHLYDDVDDVMVHDAMREGLDDIDAFAAAIARLAAG